MSAKSMGKSQQNQAFTFFSSILRSMGVWSEMRFYGKCIYCQKSLTDAPNRMATIEPLATYRASAPLHELRFSINCWGKGSWKNGGHHKLSDVDMESLLKVREELAIVEDQKNAYGGYSAKNSPKCLDKVE